jgi:putative transposase
MSCYVRPRVPGATIFFTIALADRSTDLLTREIDRLRDAVRRTRDERTFRIDAWVVLPDHLHCVWTLPPNDHDFSTRWSVIKARFSLSVAEGAQRPSHIVRRERGLWQRRFWEHHIRDEDDFEAHVSYCWHNPVKHGLVARPGDWAFSSWHRDNRIASGAHECAPYRSP